MNEEEFISVRETLVKDYLQDKYRRFKNIKEKYSIDKHDKTNKFSKILSDKRCISIQ